MNNCAKLFWNPHTNVEVMTQTSSNYDHFIIWPSSVTLTFNLPEQMFQMNKCAKIFWNPYISVEAMAWTGSIYDYFIIWLSSVTLVFNLPEKMFQMALLVLEDNKCAKLFWNPYISVQVMTQTNLDGPTHECLTHAQHMHITEIVTTMSGSQQVSWTIELNGRNGSCFTRNWPRGYKTFFMFNSVEHEIFPAHKY